MGLDMYLQRRRNVSQQAFTDSHDDKLSGVIYWRKANAIHNYFVDTGSLAPDGDEDVGYYSIKRAQLVDLIDNIDKILSGQEIEQTIKYSKLTEEGINTVEENKKYNLNVELAEELLPTTSGFFFGSTEYDYWYYKDLVRTRDLLKKELDKVPNQKTWVYYASW